MVQGPPDNPQKTPRIGVQNVLVFGDYFLGVFWGSSGRARTMPGCVGWGVGEVHRPSLRVRLGWRMPFPPPHTSKGRSGRRQAPPPTLGFHRQCIVWATCWPKNETVLPANNFITILDV